jgi:thiol-disulfide isomerase/thioredoxin
MKNLLLGLLIGLVIALIAFFIFAQYSGEKYIELFEGMDLHTPDLNLDSSINAKGSLKFDVVDIRTGADVSTDSLFNNKVVVLNFWETWCSPCRIEMRAIDKLDSLIKDSSVVFGIISTQDIGKVRKDAMLKTVSLPFYHLKSPMPASFSGTSIPRTYIINKKGEILVSEVGASAWDDSTVVHLIDSLKRAE